MVECSLLEDALVPSVSLLGVTLLGQQAWSKSAASSRPEWAHSKGPESALTISSFVTLKTVPRAYYKLSILTP